MLLNEDKSGADKDMSVLFLLLDSFINSLEDIGLSDKEILMSDDCRDMFLLGKIEAYKDVLEHACSVLESHNILKT